MYFLPFRKCIHGTCTNINGLNNNCICELGWRGEACDECRPYCDCPNQKVNACMFPNECHCEVNTNDPKGLCTTTLASTGTAIYISPSIMSTNSYMSVNFEIVVLSLSEAEEFSARLGS